MRRITQGLVLLLVLGLSVGLISCGGDDDDEDVAGTYQGTLTVGANTAQLTVILRQSGNSLSGEYTTILVTGAAPLFGNGTFTGTINGSQLGLIADPNAFAPPCQFVVTGNIDDDDITATYVSSGCAVAETGSINISR